MKGVMPETKDLTRRGTGMRIGAQHEGRNPILSDGISMSHNSKNLTIDDVDDSPEATSSRESQKQTDDARQVADRATLKSKEEALAAVSPSLPQGSQNLDPFDPKNHKKSEEFGLRPGLPRATCSSEYLAWPRAEAQKRPTQCESLTFRRCLHVNSGNTFRKSMGTCSPAKRATP